MYLPQFIYFYHCTNYFIKNVIPIFNTFLANCPVYGFQKNPVTSTIWVPKIILKNPNYQYMGPNFKLKYLF